VCRVPLCETSWSGKLRSQAKLGLTCKNMATQQCVVRILLAMIATSCVALRSLLRSHSIQLLTYINITESENGYAATQIWESRARDGTARSAAHAVRPACDA
jgi:hypothetical protein